MQAYRADVQFMLAEQRDGAIAVTTVSDVVAQNGYGAATSYNVSNNAQAQAGIQRLLDAAKARVGGGAQKAPVQGEQNRGSRGPEEKR